MDGVSLGEGVVGTELKAARVERDTTGENDVVIP